MRSRVVAVSLVLVAASAGCAAPTSDGLAPLTTVVALGDSVASGAGCGCTTFVSLLATAQSAKDHHLVTAVNLARSGLTSSGLLQQVSRTQLTAAPTTVTVITIGANDFSSQVLSTPGCRTVDDLICFRPELAALTSDLAAVLRLLTTGPHGPVLVTGYWNVFLGGAVGAAQDSAYTRDSAALTSEVNTALAKAARSAGAWYVDLLGPFSRSSSGETALLAPDGDHPSALGHVVIARALESVLEERGR